LTCGCKRIEREGYRRNTKKSIKFTDVKRVFGNTEIVQVPAVEGIEKACVSMIDVERCRC